MAATKQMHDSQALTRESYSLCVFRLLRYDWNALFLSSMLIADAL